MWREKANSSYVTQRKEWKRGWERAMVTHDARTIGKNRDQRGVLKGEKMG